VLEFLISGKRERGYGLVTSVLSSKNAVVEAGTPKKSLCALGRRTFRRGGCNWKGRSICGRGGGLLRATGVAGAAAAAEFIRTGKQLQVQTVTQKPVQERRSLSLNCHVLSLE
jgi:hypothetical protein